MPLLNEPHRCKLPNAYNYNDGTYYGCDECKIVWKVIWQYGAKSWIRCVFSRLHRRRFGLSD